MKKINLMLVAFLVLSMTFVSCNSDDDTTPTPDGEEQDDDGDDTASFVGAVYAMTNGEGQVAGTNIQGPNTIIAYGRADDGSLTPIGPFATGGNGGDYDGGEGLDPLISAYALTKTDDNENLLAVNAGSNTITSFNIAADFSLEAAGDPLDTGAIGPNSIATTDDVTVAGTKGLVYVSNITRPEFLAGGEPMHQGTVTGYWLLESGELQAIPGSTRDLPIRPSAVQFSPDGQWLVITSINSGAVALGSGSEDEVTVYNVGADGVLSPNAWGTATSTLRDNTEGRKLTICYWFSNCRK